MSAHESESRQGAEAEAKPPREAWRLPADRAFVIQLTADTGAEHLAGRAEHIASGKNIRFSSSPELLSFLTTALLAGSMQEATGEEKSGTTDAD